MVKVFVYGTLKPGEANYPKYCAGKVVDAKPAYALGQLFALPQGYPAMIKGDNQVYGYLLTFAHTEALTELDELEDYHPSRHDSENLYNREQIEIFTLETKIEIPSINQASRNQVVSGKANLHIAWVYLMSENQVHQFKGILKNNGWWSGKNISIEQFLS
ncbi:MAG: gamma-glutamylcyclotransferase [Methylacidiphilales bacterium]|nr:gamma-glutamylcyclotransferase [Candidatus Methylacidiphilales bacterium]NJR16537.1 gamma-glutamylcyclotransferase [Calothrix sp. CSU_2_0]